MWMTTEDAGRVMVWALAKRKLLSEIEEAVFSEAGVNYSYAYARASAGLNGED